ncbi:NAD(P)-dependent oxidoreductase [Xanthobacter autotrophicus DSM 431]|uniref:NAD(P)-dependent oxidoreductase n=1 Tax=Xanthobacter nonsaccharivorans TaxID=3119912 RepID=UPI0037284A0E
MSEAKPELSAVGFIGLGNMGGPMALRLLAAGHAVSVCGRDARRLDPVLAAGAVRCADPAEVAAASDMVLTCVTNTDAVEEVLFGTRGLVHGARPGLVVVDMSTVSPDATRRWAEYLNRNHGIAWLDAPVSGGPSGAASGTLAIMVGGSPAVFARARPVLAHLGRPTLVGEAGAGQTTKLVNQILVAGLTALVAEAQGLAARAGLDVAALPQALAGGRADSVLLQLFWPRMAAGDYAPTSTVTSILKDLAMVESMGRAKAAALPLTALVTELNRWLVAQGHAGEDITALYRFYRPASAC